MTPKKFLLIFFLQWLFLGLVKALFFKYQIFANAGVQQTLFWVLTVIITAALVRRLGPITFLEAFIVAVAWTLGDLLLDLIFVSAYAGLAIFFTGQYWMGLLLMIVTIMVGHNMRHIHIRHQSHHH